MAENMATQGAEMGTVAHIAHAGKKDTSSARLFQRTQRSETAEVMRDLGSDVARRSLHHLVLARFDARK